MKALKILFVFTVLSCFAVATADSEAVVVKDQTWYFWGYESYDAHQVVAPDGTINLRVNWIFSLDDPMIVEAILNGAYTMDVWAFGDGFAILTQVTFFPNGRVKLNGHYEPPL